MIRLERRIRIARDYLANTEERTALWTDEALLDLYEWMRRDCSRRVRLRDRFFRAEKPAHAPP